jgi:outer membrane protein assembly factor BamB
MKPNPGLARWIRLGMSLLLVAGLAACGGLSRPKPVALGPLNVTQPVHTVWSLNLGDIQASMVPVVTPQGQVVMATQAGELLSARLSDGQVTERVALNQVVSAGVGSDGRRHALVTRDNVLIVVSQGKLLWQEQLSSRVYTPPLVAGERVFVLLADRTVQAYDGASGRALWSQPRPGEPLVLSQTGTLMAHQNTLVAGLSGRLTGFDPTTGQIVWDAPMASPRGLNDLERLVDIVGLSTRHDALICARAYLAQVGCVDARRGQLVWSRSAQGDQGLGGLGTMVVGTEANGLVLAWQRNTGDRLWESDRLKYRRLSAPVVTDKAVWIADEEGQVYVLNRANGQLSNRLSLDGSPLIAPPIQHSQTVVMVTRKGLVRAMQAP